MRLIGRLFVLLTVLAAGFGLGVLASGWDTTAVADDDPAQNAGA